MKTLIIGAKGMLGQELALAFIKDKPFLWGKDEIDITDEEQVRQKISDLAPELIVNAAAYTNVDGCETNEELATKVNGAAVGYLAKAAAEVSATLVHYSTDYVFDGGKKEGYVEDDKPAPINAYGRSKLAGEQAILSLRGARRIGGRRGNPDASATNSGIASVASLPRNDNLNYYLIRTAWLYGPHGKNFVETMLALADKGQPIKVVNDQFGCPTYAPDLAKATLDLVESGKPAGIYHRTNSGVTTWYEFAQEIFKVFDKKVDLSPCSTADYPTPAKRPAYTVLASTKLPAMREWREALGEYKVARNSGI